MKDDGGPVPEPAGDRDAQLLAGLRILVFALWIHTGLSASLSGLALIPLELLQPTWILSPISPDAWEWILRPRVLTAFQVSMLLAATAALIGMRPYRPIALAVALLATFDQALRRSYGYGDHPEILLLLTTWVMALAPAADRLSWPQRPTTAQPGEYRAAIAFVALLACISYFAPAAYRVAHHGWATLFSPTMLYASVQNSFRVGTGSVGQFLLQHEVLSQCIQPLVPLATILELAAPLALLSRSFRRLWLLFPIAFHVVGAFVMGVPFWENMLIATAALIAFDRAALGPR